MAAFNSMLLGAVYDPLVPDRLNTSILRTVLADTEELAFIRDWQPLAVDADFPNLQEQLSNSTQATYQGMIAKSDATGHRGTLKTNLEGSFENFTISLMSDLAFRYVPTRTRGAR